VAGAVGPILQSETIEAHDRFVDYLSVHYSLPDVRTACLAHEDDGRAPSLAVVSGTAAEKKARKTWQVFPWFRKELAVVTGGKETSSICKGNKSVLTLILILPDNSH